MNNKDQQTLRDIRHHLMQIASDLERIDHWIRDYLELGQPWQPTIPRANPKYDRPTGKSTRQEIAGLRRQCLDTAMMIARPQKDLRDPVISAGDLGDSLRRWLVRWPLLTRGLEQDWADLAHGDRGDTPREDYMDMEPMINFTNWMNDTVEPRLAEAVSMTYRVQMLLGARQQESRKKHSDEQHST
jgi:hypothetical protein